MERQAAGRRDGHPETAATTSGARVVAVGARRTTWRKRGAALAGVALLVGAVGCGQGSEAQTSPRAADESSAATEVSLAASSSTTTPVVRRPPQQVPTAITVSTPTGILATYAPPGGTGGAWSCHFYDLTYVRGADLGGIGIDRDSGPIAPVAQQSVAFECTDEHEVPQFVNVIAFDPARPLAALEDAGLAPPPTSEAAPGTAIGGLPAVVPSKVTVTGSSVVFAELEPPAGTGAPWTCRFFGARSYGGAGSAGLGPDLDAGPIDPAASQPVVLVCTDDAGGQTYTDLVTFDPDQPLAALRAAGLEPAP